jgi:hypothetical protein
MKQKSGRHGMNTLIVEITHISQHGIWLLFNEKELFLSYENFPWFKKASVEQIHNVELQSENHLYWKDLDVDLNTTIIENPEKFSLVSNR